MPTTVVLPLFLLVLLIGAALGYLLAALRSTATRAKDAEAHSTAREEAARWRARAEELAERAQLAEERSERDGSVLRALAPVRAQLEQVGTRVAAMEEQRAAQHASLSEQLRAGAEAERELRRTTSELAGALRSRSSRGLWGEVELARILEASGMMPHVDFAEQRSLGAVLRSRTAGSGAVEAASSTSTAAAGSTGRASEHSSGRASARPDVVIRLPGEGYLALDAKAPMDSYLTALGPGSSATRDEQERTRLMAAHAKALRNHVDALASRRYDQALGSSPELVVLFVPAEPVLAAALDADPSLLDHALSRGVALTSPSSLLALLRTCATAWARTAVNDDAAELLEVGRTLYERLGTVAGHLDALGGALTRSVGAYNRAVSSLESRLLVTARSFETLATALDRPRLVGSDDAQVRHLTSPELAPEGRQGAETGS